jgi:hypothetical protein
VADVEEVRDEVQSVFDQESAEDDDGVRVHRR